MVEEKLNTARWLASKIDCGLLGTSEGYVIGYQNLVLLGSERNLKSHS